MSVIVDTFRTHQFSLVQSLSRVQVFATPWIAARQASLSITNSHSSLKLMSIELVMPSSHLILCRPLLLLPPIPPSIRVFSNGLVGSPCRPRDSQESSPTPRFKSINSSGLSFLHSPTLTSVHDFWKKHYDLNVLFYHILNFTKFFTKFYQYFTKS